MIEPADFTVLVGKAMAVPGRSHMRPVIEKELLHFDILFSLEQAGLLDQLTFQGGTSLRLCYGSPRFSEDLDFAGGRDFSSQQLANIKDCIEHYIGKRYELEVTVKTPKEVAQEPEYWGLNISKWQISVITAPKQKHLPQQRIKLEVANIPSYSREPRALQLHYDFLPDGYGDTLVMAESLDEVMADKLVSLVNTGRYVRHRDIWDLRWLKQQGARVNRAWINLKLGDYRVEDYPGKLDTMWQRLPDIVKGETFRAEMGRFIPLDVQERTLAKPKFGEFLVGEVQGLLDEVRRGLGGAVGEGESVNQSV